MKRVFVFFGVVILSAVTGAATMGVATNYFRLNSSAATSQPVKEATFAAHGNSDTVFASQVINTDYPDLTYAAERAVPAVVNIEAISEVSTRQYPDPIMEFFGFPQGSYNGGTREARTGGSGVIISEDGYIVTNNHVVENSKKLRVKLHDGRVFDGVVIGSDPSTDVALIKIEATGLPTIPFGSSDELRLGEWVLAIGYPMNLQSTITAGIVSAKARSLGALNNSQGIESFIQTDAAVNPGNSGGALVNTRGELIGINTIIKTSTGSYVGYSFAVPETIVRKVVIDLKESGVVQRAVLGISFHAVDQTFIDEMGEATGIDKIGGIYVASVTDGGAASEAGLRKGDVILEMDGHELTDAAIFLEQMGKRRPGDKSNLVVRRGDKQIEVHVTMRNKAGRTELLTRDDVDVAALLGGQFATATSKLCVQLDIRGGVQVTKVTRGGLLERARVREGYIITHINNRSITSVEDLNKLTEKVESIDGVYPNGKASSYTIL